MNNNDSNEAKGIFPSKQDTSFLFSSNTMMDNAFQEETVINQLYFLVQKLKRVHKDTQKSPDEFFKRQGIPHTLKCVH